MTETPTRRKFLQLGWKIGGAILGLAAGWTLFESLRPLASGASGATFSLGNASSYPPDSATYVAPGRLFVTNVGGSVFALSQKCPHLGCRVPYCDSSGRFECPCHGSVFDLGGEWIDGPSPRGMDRYHLTVDDAGALTVDTSIVEEGPDRGASQYLSPPKGPSCLEKKG